MACAEGFEGKKKITAPATFNMTTGVICATFGVQHPICKLVDQVLPNLFPTISHLSKLGVAIKNKALQRAIRDAKRVKKIQDAFDLLPDADIDTAAFCLADTPELPQDISWWDVFGAYSGLFPDALIDKIGGFYAYEKWFEYCECKPKEPDDRPPSGAYPDPPTYRPPGVKPEGCECLPDSVIIGYGDRDTAIAGANAIAESANNAGASPPYTVQWRTFARDDWDFGCISGVCSCEYSYDTVQLFVGNTEPLPSQWQTGYADGLRYIKRCPPPQPDPSFDPTKPPTGDNPLDVGCDDFPDPSFCDPCPPAGGNCVEVAVEVAEFVDCQTDPIIKTVYLNDCQPDESVNSGNPFEDGSAWEDGSNFNADPA